MDQPKGTEAELENFRQKWREEVTARSGNTGSNNTRNVPGNTQPNRRAQERRKQPGPFSSANKVSAREDDDFDDYEARTYHDLPDKEADLRLNAAEHGLIRGGSTAQPTSALEHYEKAVERETQGSLGDSLQLYRKAFKLDDGVHEKYKTKHFPPSSFPPKPPASLIATQQKPPQPNPSNASTTVPNPAHHSLAGVPPTISQLVDDFSALSIPGAPPPTDADPAPPCPMAELPGEILSDIMKWTAVMDLSAMSRLSQVCKRFAYLAMTDEQVWKRITRGPEYGFAAMHYDYVCDIKGEPLDNFGSDAYIDESTVSQEQAEDGLELVRPTLTKTTPEIDNILLHSVYAASWRRMFRTRPRIRFNGCYISTVNYTRPGAASTDSRTWGTPIHIVTYFRYLRFFRDGTVISLLTTTEPPDVVHHLVKENLRAPKDHTRLQHSSILPSAVMKDALRGRWRLSGPGDGLASAEAEGDVHIETEGVVPKYMWKMQFSLGSAGRATKNNKLTWKGFWSYNKLTDDWGEFGLKNDKAFYFSRVKSYGMGY